MKVHSEKSFEMKSEENDSDAPIISSSQRQNEFSSFLIFCIVITVIGGTFAVGWNIGEFNTPSQTLKRFFVSSYHERFDKDMSNDTLVLLWSMANGLMPLGGAFGGLLTGVSIQYFGHIRSMLLINILVVINAALFVLSKFIYSYETIIVGRFITGFVSGFFCGVCPIYLSEIAPISTRGLIGTVNALAMCIGNLVTNILGLPTVLGSDTLWPLLLALIVIPAAVHVIGLPFCVESPKYLYIVKRDESKAKQALLKLRGPVANKILDAEVEQLAEEKRAHDDESEFSYVTLVKNPVLRKALIVSVMLQASQQFSGIIVVIFYSADIFISLGLDSNTWAVYAAIAIAFVETVMHGFTMFIIDKWGRRLLLLVGMLGMSLCLFLLAITRIFSDQVEWFRIVAIIAAIIYIIFYSIGPGPIPLLVTAEFFETKSRGKAVSIAVFFNWFFNFLVTISFPFIDEAIKGYSFIIYGVLLIGFSAFTYFKVPETKNKSVQEIIKNFE